MTTAVPWWGGCRLIDMGEDVGYFHAGSLSFQQRSRAVTAYCQLPLPPLGSVIEVSPVMARMLAAFSKLPFLPLGPVDIVLIQAVDPAAAHVVAAGAELAL